jgi:hypothetical protein
MTSIAISKAIRRRAPRPSDIPLAAIAARIAQLNALKTLAVTQEFNDIANTIATHVSAYQAEPSLGDESLTFYTYQSNLHTFADPKHTAYVAALNALGADEATQKPRKESFSIEYTWTWNFGESLYIKVHLSASESEGTASCRKVQTGTRIIEQPIYSYDCAVDAEGTPLPPPVIDVLTLD